MTEQQANTHAEGWENCPQGELGRLVGGLRGQRRTRQTLTAVGAVASVLVLITIGSLMVRTSKNSEHGGIACREVKNEARDYVAGNLQPERVAQFKIHLEHCPRCQAMVDKLKLEAGVPTVGYFGQPPRNPKSSALASL